jgi:hypothetical protein
LAGVLGHRCIFGRWLKIMSGVYVSPIGDRGIVLAAVELSHFTGLTRLKGMGRDISPIALAAVVMLHLLVSVLHGWAHGTAGVVGNAPSMAFVLIVIIAGPLVGLVWMWKNAVVGARIIGVTMAASLIFGVINHFIIASPDRVDYVVGHSQTLFQLTALLLVLSEAAGAALGFSYGRSRRTEPSHTS